MVTIYAFSIENFKRSKYEVDALMDMAKVKLSQLAQHGDLLDRYGASIRVLGRRELVKRDVLDAVDRAVELTSRNGDAILNICFPYTSRDEITGAIRDTVVDYSKPVEPTQFAAQRTPFSEKHIAHNIRSRGGGGGSKSLEQDELDAPSQKEENVSSPDELEVDINQDSSLSDSSQFSSSTTLHHHSPSAGEDQSDSGRESLPATTNVTDSTPRSRSKKPVFRSPETISSKTLTQHMFTADNPPLDLLVRTSGVERLSDFMLWQCHENTQIVFLETLWPEFDLWTFLPVMWEWQWRARKFGVGKNRGEGLAIEGLENVDGDAVAEAGRKERGRRSRARDGIETKSL